MGQASQWAPDSALASLVLESTPACGDSCMTWSHTTLCRGRWHLHPHLRDSDFLALLLWIFEHLRHLRLLVSSKYSSVGILYVLSM